MMRELTGRHVLVITLSAFGVIIAVNLFMAFMAVGTFPGLEVKSSYVASQSFDRDRAAQEALHWAVTPKYDGQEMLLTIRDQTGYPAHLKDLQVTVGRPSHMRDDLTPEFTYSNGTFRAPLQLASGVWVIHLSATALDGTVFRQRIDHYDGNQVE